MVIVPTHDHTAYQFKLLDRFLADGEWSPDERQAIKDYEAQLFDGKRGTWHLPDSALPHYLPPDQPGKIGAVSEPDLIESERAQPLPARQDTRL